jgi:hypothetical protein
LRTAEILSLFVQSQRRRFIAQAGQQKSSGAGRQKAFSGRATSDERLHAANPASGQAQKSSGIVIVSAEKFHSQKMFEVKMSNA